MRNFYMFLVNYVKVGVICCADIINRLYDPFIEPPTPYVVNADAASLSTLFNTDLMARFMQPSGEFLYQRPRPSDAGDTALFQGLATGMMIMKGANVTKQIEFIRTLFLNGALIRGYRDDGTINDTTSNDSATGMLFFFYCALRFGDVRTQLDAGSILCQWARNLKANKWALVDQTGKPTKYGVLEDGIKTDPLRITLLLGILALAKVYDQDFSQDYADLYVKHRPILAYPKVKLLWWDTSYDTHRAAIHLHILDYVFGNKEFKDGLKRIWRITHKEHNAWVYTLCSPAFNKPDASIIKSSLSTFDFAKRQLGNLESLNDSEPQVKWGEKIRCKYALPINKRGSQDFFWQRHMFSLIEWKGNKSADTYHSGLDFLICGYLAYRLELFK